jgi:DNA-binding NtrC family response regulator
MKIMANILVVEDYQSLQKIYSKALTDAGHTVLIASNGNEGLSLAASNHIDLILLDILMPQAGGFQFLEAYNIRSHPDVKLIVLTNMTGVDFLNKAMTLGASNYLIKSDIKPDELVKTVNSTLSSAAPTA